MRKQYKTVDVSKLDEHLNSGWSLESLSHPTAVISFPEAVCPECGHYKDNPKRYVKADGYRRLNIYCEHEFHN